MSPFRRARLLLIAAFLVLLIILYITADQRQIRNQKIYQKTVEALDAKHARKQGEKENDGGIFKKLKPGKLKPEDAQAVAVDRPKHKSPTVSKGKPDGDGKSVAGRVKVPPSGEKKKGVPEQKNDSHNAEIEAEFNTILKRSPSRFSSHSIGTLRPLSSLTVPPPLQKVIIFSKTYCPYSRKAKNIMLKRYSIVPAPFIVELDEHPLGSELQALLASNTGRRTVPNILINGMSIGGGDDIEALDVSRELEEKIKKMVGKRLVEARRLDPDAPA
ncbi:hypothetical protein PRK78_001100 [Emydomyces testavorans]|uniref:Glutaredoxin domain-containing protein n=1 Tax=Emydomyces testavorans TaxID=2070801 RepID=A0AAF0DBW6_9EURO|nr:hypothetical protein PRK78_001100 [Emydomyces testavorans]